MAHWSPSPPPPHLRQSARPVPGQFNHGIVSWSASFGSFQSRYYIESSPCEPPEKKEVLYSLSYCAPCAFPWMLYSLYKVRSFPSWASLRYCAPSTELGCCTLSTKLTAGTVPSPTSPPLPISPPRRQKKCIGQRNARPNCWKCLYLE